MSFLFDPANFSSTTLTTRAQDAVKFPFIETQARSLFRTRTVIGSTVQLDREALGATLLPTGTRGTTASAQSSTRARSTHSVASVKIGDRLVIDPTTYDSIRMTGLREGDQVALKTFESEVDEGLVEKFGSLDHTHEFLAATALKGIVLDPTDGSSTLIDYPTLFSVSQPATVYLDLQAATPAMGVLRQQFLEGQRTIRDNLGGFVPTGYVVFHGSQNWSDFENHEELRDAFRRRDGGEFLAAGSAPINFAGAQHVEYRGTGIAADESVMVPTGVPGMFDYFYCSGDKVGFTNLMGLPRYVVAKNVDDPLTDFAEGAEWEISSFPVPVNLRPEAVVVFDGGADPN